MALNKMEHTHMMLYIRFAGYPNDPTMEPTQPSTIYIYIQTDTLHTNITYIYITHIVSCHLISCHVISCHLMPSHPVSSHVMSSHVISCHVMSSHIMPCHLISSHVISVFVYLMVGVLSGSPHHLAPAPRLETSPGQQEGQGCQGRRRGRGHAKSSGGCGEVAW